MHTQTLLIADDNITTQRVEKPLDPAPKPRKTRASSTRRPSARRVSALAAAKRAPKRAAKPASRRRPSARRARTVMAGAITPEMLAKSVSEAVGLAVGQAIADAITHAITHVIAGYERTHGLAPEPAVKANIESVATSVAKQFKARSLDAQMVVHGDTTVLNQLRRDMGLDDFVMDDVSERKPAEVLGGWAEELEWLASELGNVRDPESFTPEWARDLATGPDHLSPRALPARVAAWLEACDPTPRLASFAADTIASLRSGTSPVFEPFRGGQVRVRTWVVSLATGLRML